MSEIRRGRGIAAWASRRRPVWDRKDRDLETVEGTLEPGSPTRGRKSEPPRPW